ncbi:hypothetical protein EDC04DRAFT_2599413 [Pisolithus marmoratus]|nr:hypothetical protein EDC04DRAFT_2599413 [Pisolithus marmoratus]
MSVQDQSTTTAAMDTLDSATQEKGPLLKASPFHKQAVHGDNHIREHAYRSIIPVQPGRRLCKTAPSQARMEDQWVMVKTRLSACLMLRFLQTWSLVRLEYKTAVPHFLFVLGPPRMMALPEKCDDVPPFTALLCPCNGACIATTTTGPTHPANLAIVLYTVFTCLRCGFTSGKLNFKHHPRNNDNLRPPVLSTAGTVESTVPVGLAASDPVPRSTTCHAIQTCCTSSIAALGFGLGYIRLPHFSGRLSGEGYEIHRLQFWDDLAQDYFTLSAVMNITLWKDNKRINRSAHDLVSSTTHPTKWKLVIPVFVVTTSSQMTLSLDHAPERLLSRIMQW